MAIIERMRDMAAYGAELEACEPGALLAQQICQRGAIDAIEALQELGATPANAAALLTSLRSALHTLHEVAHRRGVELWSYTP